MSHSRDLASCLSTQTDMVFQVSASMHGYIHERRWPSGLCDTLFGDCKCDNDRNCLPSDPAIQEGCQKAGRVLDVFLYTIKDTISSTRFWPPPGLTPDSPRLPRVLAVRSKIVSSNAIFDHVENTTFRPARPQPSPVRRASSVLRYCPPFAHPSPFPRPPPRPALPASHFCQLLPPWQRH
jgi:hypothetical protein